MIKKLINLRLIFGKKNYFLLTSVLFLSLISGFLELIGIGLLGVFAISLNDPTIIIEKIPFKDLKLYLSNFNRIELITFSSILIIIIFLIKHSFSFLISFFEISVSKKILLDVKKKIFEYFLVQDYEYFLNNNKSYLVNMVSSQVQSFMGYIFQVFSILKELILIILIFFGMIYINWKIILFITITLILLTIFFGKFFKKKLNELGDKSRKLEKDETQYLNEAYQGIKFIKLGTKEKFFLNLINDVVTKKNKYEIYHYLVGKLPKIYLEMIIIVIFISIVIFLLIGNENNETVLGTITFLAFSSVRLLPSFITINNSYSSLAFFRSPFEIIYKMMFLLRDNKEKSSRINLKENISKIVFQNVNFKYLTTKKPILNDISFEINKNDFLGIIGKSGSGKSTILHLLSGLLKPTNGRIILNEIEQHDISDFDLNNKISYISQDSFIFDNSLENNIAFANHEDEINEERIDKSIKFTNLSEFLNNLPEKTKSILGDAGSKISHGQRQRIGLARAIYNESNIIILDESLNALDYQNEKQILSNFRNLKDKILIFVSHRLESLNFCNKLLILDEGQIKDFGAKSEVLFRNKDLKKYFN